MNGVKIRIYLKSLDLFQNPRAHVGFVKTLTSEAGFQMSSFVLYLWYETKRCVLKGACSISSI